MITTTKQIRAIMRRHNAFGIYTNKTTGDSSNNRRVKCYYFGNKNLLNELFQVAGRENVTLTPGSNDWGTSVIVVKCILS